MQRRYKLADRKLVETQDESATVAVFVNPTADERKLLVNELKIDEHNLVSALDPDELSRVEFEPEHHAIIYSRPQNYCDKDRFLFKCGTVGGFLYKDRLVVVVSEDVPLFDSVQISRVQTPGGLLLKLILGAVIHFRGHLKAISAIADELQNEINRAMENQQLYHLFTLERSLVYYLNFIHSNGLLLERLKTNGAKIGFTADEMEMLDDIIIENSQCYKQAEIHSNILAGLMDARASIVANNLNVIMRNLMIITIAIMVPTLVVSIFSMNVALPIQHARGAFWFILAMASVSAAVVLGLRRFRRL